MGGVSHVSTAASQSQTADTSQTETRAKAEQPKNSKPLSVGNIPVCMLGSRLSSVPAWLWTRQFARWEGWSIENMICSFFPSSIAYNVNSDCTACECYLLVRVWASKCLPAAVGRNFPFPRWARCNVSSKLCWDPGCSFCPLLPLLTPTTLGAVCTYIRQELLLSVPMYLTSALTSCSWCNHFSQHALLILMKPH